MSFLPIFTKKSIFIKSSHSKPKLFSVKNRLLETDDSNQEKRKLTQDQNTQLKASVDLQVKSSLDNEDVGQSGPDLKKVNFGGWKMEVDNTNIKPPTPEPPPQEKSEKKFYLKKARVKNYKKMFLRRKQLVDRLRPILT